MRKIIPCVCWLLLMFLVIICILKLSSNDTHENTTDEYYTNTIQLRSTVETGIIKNIIISDGNVVGNSSDLYIENVVVNIENTSETNPFKTEYKIGDVLEKNDVLYSYLNRDVKVEYDCKIVNITTTEKTVEFSLLNYENLFIVSSIDYYELDLIDFDTKVTVSLDIKDTVNTFDAKISNFGYEVIDGKVDIQIHCDEKLLPGTPVKITFESENDVESLYILKQMLMLDGDTYYVEVEDNNGTRVRKNIQIGEFFEEYNDGELIEYVEIKSGLEFGEKLIIDIVG